MKAIIADKSFLTHLEHVYSSIVMDVDPGGPMAAPVDPGASFISWVIRISEYKGLRVRFDTPSGWDAYFPDIGLAINLVRVALDCLPYVEPRARETAQAAAKERSIRLIHITDLEWETNRAVVIKTLRHALGLTAKRYYARKLRVVRKEVLTTARRMFYESNHLQGAPRRGISYALMEGRKIRALMTFSSVQSVRGTVFDPNLKEFELIRYASAGYVVGGASRLLTAFIREYNPSKIISFSQNDYFDGSMYSTLGFKLVKALAADYRTVWASRLRHKSYTKRSNLARILAAFDPDLTERQNLIDAKIPIVYDAGKRKWVWTRT